jgi:hypothetical protein
VGDERGEHQMTVFMRKEVNLCLDRCLRSLFLCCGKRRRRRRRSIKSTNRNAQWRGGQISKKCEVFPFFVCVCVCVCVCALDSRQSYRILFGCLSSLSPHFLGQRRLLCVCCTQRSHCHIVSIPDASIPTRYLWDDASAVIAGYP